MKHERTDRIVGVDFGAPKWARDQRRKIIAIEAVMTDWRRYTIGSGGLNERFLHAGSDPPGWSGAELLNELLERPVKIVAFDFPFSLPETLLRDPEFAANVGHLDGPFMGWREFSYFVARNLKLTDPLDFGPFEPWRRKGDRARLWARRATDLAAGGQPPLKDKFQLVFQMTLLGNALLSRMWEAGKYRIIPFGGSNDENVAIEVYPRFTLRRQGMNSYKARPGEAIRVALEACQQAGLTVEVDPGVLAFCQTYSSTRRTPDHDAADAFVALCTGILYREGACREATNAERFAKLSEGAIWVPKDHVAGDT